MKGTRDLRQACAPLEIFVTHEIKLVELTAPALSGLLGVIIGGFITAHYQSKERQYNRVREQLQGFYAPLYGMRAQIREKGAFLRKISKATEEISKGLAVAPPGVPEDAHFNYVQNRMQEFGKADSETNRQVNDVILPLYRQMFDRFSSHMGLAEPATLDTFGTLVEFVETWDRWASKPCPMRLSGSWTRATKSFNRFTATSKTNSPGFASCWEAEVRALSAWSGVIPKATAGQG